MARPRPVIAGAAALLTLLTASVSPAWAQRYRTLHVDALSMVADRTRVPVGQVFHIAIHVHVRENVSNLDELVIPDLGRMEPLGDERTVSHARGGTDVVETLTLAPVQPGTFAFLPAYLDAIDARTGRPSRFSSRAVRVTVIAARPALGASVVDAGVRPLLLRVVQWAVGMILALIALIAVLRIERARRRAVVVAAAPVVVAPPEPVRTPRDEVAAALRRYRTSPANGVLLELRAALFAAAGVPAGATLRDALAAATDPSLRAALNAAEQAAFGPAALRDVASAELIGATERWLS
ncbi:MAG TPA: hypothetical protein VMD91_05205 [Candidatus Sulfotelmatobacter sp.]|nr:hypothetical protein [Candidatus Sulfotelmatobacter sp.]